MNDIEKAELNLRRAQDAYNKAMKEQNETGDVKMNGNGKAEYVPPPLAPNQRLLDVTQITSIEDIVSIAAILGLRVVVDIENPRFASVEHLVAEDAENDVAP